MNDSTTTSAASCMNGLTPPTTRSFMSLASRVIRNDNFEQIPRNDVDHLARRNSAVRHDSKHDRSWAVSLTDYRCDCGSRGFYRYDEW